MTGDNGGSGHPMHLPLACCPWPSMPRSPRTADERPDKRRDPNLLTRDEAVKLLRLDCLGLRDPKETLRHLRRTRQIGYVKVAEKVLIPREEVEAYLERNQVDPLS